MKTGENVLLSATIVILGMFGFFIFANALDSTETTVPGDAASKTTARFVWNTDDRVSYRVNFDASASACAAPPCSYTWDFGDRSPKGSGTKSVHDYSDGSSHKVTLTVTDSSKSAESASQQVAGVGNSAPAVASRLTVSNYAVTFIDTSKDDRSLPLDAVMVSWNDGAVSRGNAGDTFTHTYKTAGTYTILHTVTDSGGESISEVRKVKVPGRFSIVGIVTKAGGGTLAGVTVILKYLEAARAVTTTDADGSYTFAEVLPGEYTVQAFMSDYVFDGDPGTRGNQNPVTVTLGPDRTLNFVASPDTLKKGSHGQERTLPSAEEIKRVMKARPELVK
jgi:PKD repeat protein